MSGPKHLWSGDWEQESASTPDEPADGRPKLPEGVVAQPVKPRPPRVRRLRKRRRLAITRRALKISLAALLVLAVGAWALTSLLGSSGPRPVTNAARSFQPPTATVPTVPNVPTPTVPGVPTPTVPTNPTYTPPPATTPAVAPRPPVYWLGMEIETVPPGAAVIQTVGAGSAAAAAGLEPGDQIVEVNHQPVSGSNEIRPALRGLGPGAVVQLQISHGSGLYQTPITLGAPPSLYP